MLVVLVILTMLAIAAYEVPIMVRLEEWGELKLFSFLWTGGLILGVLQTLGIPLPNPTTLLITVIPPIISYLGRLVGIN